MFQFKGSHFSASLGKFTPGWWNHLSYSLRSNVDRGADLHSWRVVKNEGYHYDTCQAVPSWPSPFYMTKLFKFGRIKQKNIYVESLYKILVQNNTQKISMNIEISSTSAWSWTSCASLTENRVSLASFSLWWTKNIKQYFSAVM